MDIYTAAIDEKLDSRAYIVPGLGDAGIVYLVRIKKALYRCLALKLKDATIDEVNYAGTTILGSVFYGHCPVS